MKKIAAALAGLAIASTPTQAADLFGTAAPPMSVPADNPAVEIGSNWYIRGDIGVSFDNVPSLDYTNSIIPPAGNAFTPTAPQLGPNNNKTNFAVDVGLGYRVNNYLRFDGTYEYQNGAGFSGGNTAVCPYQLTGLTSQNQFNGIGAPLLLGYAYNYNDTCNGVAHIQQQDNLFMFNSYLDIGNFWGFTPYIGAGAGVDFNLSTGSLNYYETANGSVYSANLTPSGSFPLSWVPINPPANAAPPANIPFTQQNWNRNISSIKTGWAFAGMVGFGYQLTPSATVDIGYRFLETGFGGGQDYRFQQVKIGVRYVLN